MIRGPRLGGVIACLGLVTGSVAGADDAGAAASRPVIPSAPVIHLTDEQNLFGTGELDPKAEVTSRANALYAEAMQDGPGSSPQEAVGKLRQVVALDPHFADAEVALATLLVQLDEVPAALEQLTKAAAMNPHSVAIEAALGYAEELSGAPDEALRLGKDVLGRDPEQETAMRILLEVAAKENDLAGGVLHVEDILRGRTKVSSSAWLNLGRLFLEISRNDPHAPGGDAPLEVLLPIYQQAADKGPADVETLTLLADTYRDLGRKREALRTLEAAAAFAPSDVDIILRCADLESDLGQRTAALSNYETAYALDPTLTGLSETLGGIYLQRGRFPDAARMDCSLETYLKLAVDQLSNEKVTEAGATLGAAQGRYPQSSQVRFYQAITERYEKNYGAALASLDQARALASGPEATALNINYYMESVLDLNLSGKKNRIEETLREGLGKYPDSPDLMNELAYFWADQGSHLNEALALGLRAAQLDADNGPIEDTCGWIYFQLGQPKDALPYLQRAALLTNNDPVVLQHFGDTCLKLGLRSEALAAWRQALEKDPGNGELAHRIAAALAQAKNAHPRSALHR